MQKNIANNEAITFINKLIFSEKNSVRLTYFMRWIITFKITKIDENLSSILEKMDYGTRCRLDGAMDELGLSKICIQADIKMAAT